VSLVPESQRKNNKQSFKYLVDTVSSTITEEYCESIRRRMIETIPFFCETVDTFTSAVHDRASDRRTADNLAPIFSALWFLQNDSIPDQFDAEMFLSGYSFNGINEPTETEEHKCLSTILQLIPREWNGETVANVIAEVKSEDRFSPNGNGRKKLSSIGIGFNRDFDCVYFEFRNVIMADMLRNTPYYDSYAMELMHIDGAEKTKQRIGGRPCNCVSLPFSAVDVEEEEKVGF
jgi:hypothetical protein